MSGSTGGVEERVSGRLADAATAAAIVLLLLWVNGVAALVPGLPSSRTANALLFAFAVAALAAGFAAGRRPSRR